MGTSTCRRGTAAGCTQVACHSSRIRGHRVGGRERPQLGAGSVMRRRGLQRNGNGGAGSLRVGRATCAQHRGNERRPGAPPRNPSRRLPPVEPSHHSLHGLLLRTAKDSRARPECVVSVVGQVGFDDSPARRTRPRRSRPRARPRAARDLRSRARRAWTHGLRWPTGSTPPRSRAHDERDVASGSAESVVYDRDQPRPRRAASREQMRSRRMLRTWSQRTARRRTRCPILGDAAQAPSSCRIWTNGAKHAATPAAPPPSTR